MLYSSPNTRSRVPTTSESDGEAAGGTDGREFERAAARLFTFLGFAVAEIGHTGGSQPDFLAGVAGYPRPGGRVHYRIFPIEVETRTLGAKIRRRARRDQDTAPPSRTASPALRIVTVSIRSWRQREVLPVIISSLSPTRVSAAERADASCYNAAVLDRGDLTHLLSLARRGEAVGKVYEFVVSRIR